jgi:AAA15 family ATPase/GTPase
MFSKIWSYCTQDYSADDKDYELYYINIRKLNLFIGANNSGKSRYLRGLFKSDETKLCVAENNFSVNLQKQISTLLNEVSKENIIFGFSMKDIHKLADSFIDTVHNQNIHYQDLKNLNKAASAQSPDSREEQIVKTLYSSKYSDLTIISSPFKIPERIYIPIMRGMRPFGEKDTDNHKERTKKDYFIEKENEAIGTNSMLLIDEKSQKIITGYDLYSILKRLLLGKPAGREIVRKYEALLQDYFFEGKKITLIPEIDSDTVAVKIGDDEQFPIYDLGDGLQQVIIITSTAFLYGEKPLMVFIEEPENSLHPGLLRKLSMFLLEQTEHQYFITTHSNHLLDLAELDNNVTIHRFTKTNGNFKVRESSKNKDILADLGVKASSVYLSNCTIWVEGITDRLYLRCYMDKYIETQPDEEKENLKKYIEQYHYAFIEYQGGTLGHWNFDDTDIDSGEDSGLNALKSCPEIFLIADGDIKNKGERAKIIKEQLGDRFFILKGKEIENMIPVEVLIKTAEQLFESKNNTETIQKEDLDKAGIKTLALKKYETHMNGIGYHLDKAVGKKLKLKGKGNHPRFFADTSGTIKGKVKFCKTAVNIMNDEFFEWELTDNLKELCKQIFDHIIASNNI